jgi:hypothetical protein
MLKTVKKVSNKSPSKSLIDELPGGVKENLASGEEVIRYLKTFEVVVDPDYILLTNLRLIYFNEKHFGRYAFKSIPFQKLLQIRAHRGALLWGDISFKGEDGTVILLERVDRIDLEGFIDAVEIAYNNIAVEPISIEHERGLVGKATWKFDKPKEMIVRQQSSDQPRLSEDPLNELKTKFIRGEISEEEYKAKLRILQEK